MTTKHYPVNNPQLDALADSLLDMDVRGEWTPYTQYDLANASLVTIRVVGSMLFEQVVKRKISQKAAEDLVEFFGKAFRELIKETLEVDLHEVMRDLQALNEERRDD